MIGLSRGNPAIETVDSPAEGLFSGYMANDPLHLRVFVSSPGDVFEERRAAREVLNALQRQPLLRGRVTLDVITYDDPDAPAPMAAGETPQESVNRFSGRPADCDLTVVILWSRLGTPIPPPVQREDGSQYPSGTVWELEDALRADREVWVYRRHEVPSIGLTDPAFDKKRADYLAVEAFFQGFANPDGSLQRGFSTYARAADFGPLFEKHLEAYIRGRLDPANGAPPAAAPRGDATGTDLTISSLAGKRRVRPLAGHPVLTPTGMAEPVYSGGVQVSFTLAHNGAGKQSITLYALELELLRFTPGARSELRYQIEGEEIQGAGVAQPHVFSLSLRGDEVGPAVWVTDSRQGRVALARSGNLFDTEDARVLTFRADLGETEELQGTVLAQEAGLYEFRFAFYYSVGGSDREQVSEPLLVYFDACLSGFHTRLLDAVGRDLFA